MTKSSKNPPPFKSEEYLTPVSLSVQLTGLFLLGIVGMTVVLTSSLKYNTIVKGRAFIRPLGEIRIVHAQREGTIRDIPVKTNQKVSQGDVLAILNRQN